MDEDAKLDFDELAHGPPGILTNPLRSSFVATANSPFTKSADTIETDMPLSGSLATYLSSEDRDPYSSPSYTDRLISWAAGSPTASHSPALPTVVAGDGETTFITSTGSSGPSSLFWSLSTEANAPAETNTTIPDSLAVDDDQDSGGLSSSQLGAAIAVPVVFILLTSGMLTCCLIRRRRRRQDPVSSPQPSQPRPEHPQMTSLTPTAAAPALRTSTSKPPPLRLSSSTTASSSNTSHHHHSPVTTSHPSTAINPTYFTGLSPSPSTSASTSSQCSRTGAVARDAHPKHRDVGDGGVDGAVYAHARRSEGGTTFVEPPPPYRKEGSLRGGLEGELGEMAGDGEDGVEGGVQSGVEGGVQGDLGANDPFADPVGEVGGAGLLDGGSGGSGEPDRAMGAVSDVGRAAGGVNTGALLSPVVAQVRGRPAISRGTTERSLSPTLYSDEAEVGEARVGAVLRRESLRAGGGDVPVVRRTDGRRAEAAEDPFQDPA